MGHPFKDHHKGRVEFVAIALLLMVSLLTAQTDITLRVTAEKARAWIKPDAASQMVRQFPLGALLQSTEKIGDWYQISFTDETGFTILAYVNAGDVDVVGEAEDISYTFPESLPPRFSVKTSPVVPTSIVS